MNKLSLFFVFILFVGKAVAQKPSIVEGKVLYELDKMPLKGVHIQNIETSHYAITDDNGKFSVKAEKGNTLKFTYVGKRTLHRIVTQADLEEGTLLILKMEDETTHLGEVEVANQRVTAQSLGILQHKPIERTFDEKREYANTKILPKSWWPILLGSMPINFNALIYTISGKKKMYKKAVQNEKNTKVATYVKEHFTEFLQKSLKLTEEEIDVLAYFVMEKPEFHTAVAAKDNQPLEFMLTDAWLEIQKMTQK
ncbi:carboxypeptidase-like regulatory domain-containing protein [Capnocytophaga sp.]|uniref:carboxypeptidase-like regulatory domain-containing protein n=1 Tax=Capnocytophaga sp. TaxID=44737 RepID=UPI0026DAAFC2|nr:carboxypeptidase-like regulatory domain-containing protein [Capnocytophaga sp.]MDO5106501.1 carboxypeptidase-like regulatory domain-containing protein [Capnocytophaga sp.]